MAEDDHRVVLHLDRPELSAQEGGVEGERAEDRVAQVEEMHSLVDQLAAPGDRPVGAPLLLVADAPTVAVAGAHMEDGSERTRRGLVDRPRRARMKAMVEAHLDPSTRGLGRAGDSIDVCDSNARGLLDEDVRGRFESATGLVRQPVVRHRDDDDVELVSQKLVGRAADRPAESFGESPGRVRVKIEAGDERVLAERSRALVADEPTADDPDTKRRALGP